MSKATRKPQPIDMTAPAEKAILIRLTLTPDMGFEEDQLEVYLHEENWVQDTMRDEMPVCAEEKVNFLSKAANQVFLDHEVLVPSYKLRLLKNALKKKIREREKLEDDISSIETLMGELRKK